MSKTSVCLSGLVLFVLFGSLYVGLVDAEPSWVLWSQTYGGTDNDGEFHLVYVVETSDGGFAVAGNTESFGAGSSDFWLIKTDSDGNMEWNKTYGGADFDVLFSLILTSDGGFALAGLTGSFGVGNVDFWLVKTNSFGTLEWNQTYGGTESDNAYSLVETSDGALAILGVGRDYLNNPRTGKIHLIKTEAFLPIPSPSPLPTPFPTPIPTQSENLSPTTTFQDVITIAIIISLVAIVSLSFYFQKRKNNTHSKTG